MEVNEDSIEPVERECEECGGKLYKETREEVELVVCENHFQLSLGSRSCGNVEKNIYCYTCQEYSAHSLTQSNEESGTIYCDSCDSRKTWNS